MSVSTVLNDGRRYMKTWPMVRQLGVYFPEYRVIHATKIAISIMPLLAIITVVSQLSLYGFSFLPQAIALGLFFVSLPMQGLLWLGYRARHPLPLTLLDWGNQLNAKLTEIGAHCPPLGANACYLDMAIILKKAFEHADSDNWDELLR